MTATIEDDDYRRSILLMKVIDKQPKLFQKWCDLKDKFVSLGLYDSPFTESRYSIVDALYTINKELG
jgi:hypothetical protein